MAPTKVFVGNLSFKTGEAELAQEFSAAGKVVTANIITRGPRSLGYGFVELESEEEANQAVKLLNKKEIDGRAINVEVARPRAERAEGEAQEEGAPRRAKRNGRRRGRGVQGEAAAAAPGEPGAEQPPREPRAPRERRRGRGGAAAAAPAGDAATAGEGATNEQTAEGAEGRRRGNRTRRGGRGRADDGPREESDTTLFVANLPFSLTDEQLKTEFSSSDIPVKGAHVVVRVTGRSKGYGFVEYESKSEQTRALAAFEKKEISGRILIVKIALKDNRPAAGEAPTQEQPQQ